MDSKHIDKLKQTQADLYAEIDAAVARAAAALQRQRVDASVTAPPQQPPAAENPG